MHDIRSVSITHIGKVRSANEDAVLEGGRLFAVADGMGGHNAGEVASSMAVALIRDYMEAGRKGTPGSELLRKSVEEANAKIHEKASTAAELQDMGTTLSILYFSDAGALIGNVGDSRVYLFRDGRLERLTRDDSLVAKLIDEGVISEAEARSHPRRNVILKAVGITPEIDFEVDGREVEPGDLFLLATDGLTSLVEDSEIEAVLADGDDIRKKAKRLLKRALDSGGTDNISIIITAVDEQPGVGAKGPAVSRPWHKRMNPGRFFAGKRNLE